MKKSTRTLVIGIIVGIVLYMLYKRYVTGKDKV